MYGVKLLPIYVNLLSLNTELFTKSDKAKINTIMHQLNAFEIIEYLQLEKHPEGGYFRELYRCDEHIKKDHLPKRFSGDRAISTAIYFMLTGDATSSFHKIKSDEIWHFYAGQSLSLYQIDKSGNMNVKILGLDILKGERPQITIQKETYFGAKVNGVGYCLAGCTVAPGFDFSDFDMPGRNELLKMYPQHQKEIEMLS